MPERTRITDRKIDQAVQLVYVPMSLGDRPTPTQVMKKAEDLLALATRAVASASGVLNRIGPRYERRDDVLEVADDLEKLRCAVYEIEDRLDNIRMGL